MANPLAMERFDALQRTPASDVKKHGWRGMMRVVARHGKVVVTNHNTPEAVILSTSEYQALVEAAQAAQTQVPDSLEQLRQRFDARLATLDADDAGERLHTLAAQPARLGGQVKAGSGF